MRKAKFLFADLLSFILNYSVSIWFKRGNYAGAEDFNRCLQ